jgi:hypothetical protein
MNGKQLLLMGAAMTGLSFSMQLHAQAGAKSKTTTPAPTNVAPDMVMCHGVNSCKGSGTCHGRVDSCNGATGCDAKMSCKGQNECKGKGLLKMTKEECEKKGGKIAT